MPDDGKAEKRRRREYEEQPLPEVSEERFYSTTAALNIGGNANTCFSLRSLFQQSSDHEPIAEKEVKPEGTEFLFKPKVLKIDEGFDQQQQAGYLKKAGMWQEPLFLQKDDTRFKGKELMGFS